MVDPEKLMELARIFDNDRTKVVTQLPPKVKLSEVVGVQSYPDKTTKITVSRMNKLYLCWAPTSEVMSDILRWKEEIKKHEDWEERYEAWELFGSQEPVSLMFSLIKSRLKTPEEKRVYQERYEPLEEGLSYGA